MILIRFILISLAVYLIVRSFMRFGNDSEPEKPIKNPDNTGKPETKKISKNVGEYVDYEEISKNDL
jgi:large-conductance mechanosensitive channel